MILGKLGISELILTNSAIKISNNCLRLANSNLVAKFVR